MFRTNLYLTFQINVLIQCFSSSTYCEHHYQKDYIALYMQLYLICFSCMYASSLAGWRMVANSTYLYRNARYNKHKVNYVSFFRAE